VIRAAGLRDELTFASFRHGGFTEAGDAELTDAEMRAPGAAQVGQGASAVRQTDHAAGRQGHPKAARGANEKRTDFRNEQQQQFRN
jgi:hypothetical protein